LAFFQSPVELGNQYEDDRVLRSTLARVLPADVLQASQFDLSQLGELAGAELYRLQLADRENLPRLTQWDAWGRRIDHIEVTAVWKRAAALAVEHGLVARPYEKAEGAASRVCQFARVYLFDPSTDVYTCPLAMSDGAVKTLLAHRSAENQAFVDEAVSHLTSRDPALAWTAGQWMTERAGGSDVGASETVARRDTDCWRLHGTKWFTSAVTGQVALTLARPEGNGSGSRGLALFFVQLRDEAGRLQNIQVNRLKDKLGTRKVPTAELTLDGTPAWPVAGLDAGVKKIAPMLAITRTWNAVCSAASMRRSIALTRDYARRRVVFGAPLSEKPLHLETLADLQAEAEVGFQLAFRCAELLGREEAGAASDGERLVLRLLTSLAKLVTGKQAVAVAGEALEMFGGAGYVEDTGIPRLLRDAQVLPIWEGTTNVLSLDALKTLAEEPVLTALAGDADALAGAVQESGLRMVAQEAIDSLRQAARFVSEASGRDLEAGARGLALAVGRSYGLLLLCRHAQWSLEHERDGRAAASARRFARLGLGWLRPGDPEARALANDEPLRRG